MQKSAEKNSIERKAVDSLLGILRAVTILLLLLAVALCCMDFHIGVNRGFIALFAIFVLASADKESGGKMEKELLSAILLVGNMAYLITTFFLFARFFLQNV